jgi:hypothetical protein
VSQPVRSLRALNPPTRMSKPEFFDTPGYGESSIRRTAVQSEPSGEPERDPEYAF